VSRVLVVNADDFGLTPGVNRGVTLGHDDGIVTSASLMVRQRGAAAAARYARARTTLSVGLHADLGEWVRSNSVWQPLYEVTTLDEPGSVRDELYRQLEQFCRLLGRLPTHLDSHQHVHRTEPARSVFFELAEELAIPLRGEAAISYEGGFYGQTGTGEPLPHQISPQQLTKLFRRIPDGITELSCHPAAVADMASSYRHERVQELITLRDPRVRETLITEQITLAAFENLRQSKSD